MFRLLGFIWAAMAVMAWMTGSIAWAEEEPAVELKPVVVTADRWGEKEEEATDRVTSVSKERVEKTPARDAGEALNYMPGVVMGRGASGGATSVVFPSVQGADYYQTPVMINGVPLTDLLNGIGNIGVIPAELIQRIEVVHGAGGMEWGSTQGGLINVMMGAPDKARKDSLTVGGGQHGTIVGGLDVQHWTESLGLSIGGAYRTGDGPEKDTSKLNNTSGTFGLKALFGEKAKLDATVYTFQGVVGSGEYRDGAGYYEKFKYSVTGGGATLESDLGFAAIRLTGYAQTQNNRTDQFTIEQGKLGGVKQDESLAGGSAIMRSDLGFATMIVGADARNGTLKTNGLALDKYTINQYGAFAHLSREIGRLILQGGGRYSAEDYFGSFIAYNVGARYSFEGAPVDFRISAARGYTNPPLSFRYLELKDFWAPNPDLKVEKVMTYQAEALIRPMEGVTVDVNGFFGNLEDALGTETRPDGLSWYRNFAKAERSGVEAEIRYEAHGMDLFANTLAQTVKDKTTGEIIRGKPKAAHSLGAGYQWDRLYLQASGIWRDWNELPDNQAKDKVFILGAKAFYKLDVAGKALNISLTINNLTDAEYYNHHFAPKNDPRDIEAAVQYYF